MNRYFVHIPEKSYFSQKALNLHIKDITKGKTFNCTFCTKSFNRRGELELHNRSHTNERYDEFFGDDPSIGEMITELFFTKFSDRTNVRFAIRHIRHRACGQLTWTLILREKRFR